MEKKVHFKIYCSVQVTHLQNQRQTYSKLTFIMIFTNMIRFCYLQRKFVHVCDQ